MSKQLHTVNIDLVNKKAVVTYHDEEIKNGLSLQVKIIENKHKIVQDEVLLQGSSTDFDDIFLKDEFKVSADEIIKHL